MLISARALGTRSAWLACVLTAVLVAGCASVGRWAQESFTQPPGALDSDPATNGLVVLDFFLRQGDHIYEVQGARIRQTDAGSPERYGPRFRAGFEPMGVLFVGVPPGHYRVSELLASELRYNSGTKKQTPTTLGWTVADTSLEFDVRPASLTYVGRFDANVGRRKRIRIEWLATPMRERTVWRAIRSRYSPSRWDTLLSARIADIEASMSASPQASAADPGSGRQFLGIVMSHKLGQFSRRAGPVGFGGTLVVRRDSLLFHDGKERFGLATGQVLAVHRSGYWVRVDHDWNGAIRQVWFGYGLVNDSDITDEIEFSIASALKR